MTSKKRAYELVMQLSPDAAPSAQLLAELRDYFMPRINPSKATGLDWLRLAYDKDEKRDPCKYLWVYQQRAYVTDGHRAHSMPIDKPNGAYDIHTLQRVDPQPSWDPANMGKVAQFDRFDPSPHALTLEDMPPAFDVRGDGPHAKSPSRYDLARRPHPDWRAYNAEYLADAFGTQVVRLAERGQLLVGARDNGEMFGVVEVRV